MTDRASNRATFPETAAAVDMFTAAFGPVRVRYICEGGREVGTKDAPPPVKPARPHAAPSAVSSGNQQ